ncbi:enoyl-CoA hydratase/isomerase family protein [Streptomyces sp. NBC_00631]|uniref:enoyl-CoA hydratase/isomerase family protein n=1 Tax=Streptomyces sp. NBC_00631 TaxID=2975793 RepID=UPI0030DFAF46
MSKVKYQLNDGLAVLTIVHEGAPVIGDDLMAGLLDNVRRARAERCRGLLLRAEGHVFLAGAEAGDLQGVRESEARATHTDYLAVVHEIEDLDVPTLAAVQGMCLGGGLELALACDLIVAQKGTKLGQVEARLGGTTFVGGAQRLVERCGTSRALEITYSGRLYSADTFAAWGIVSRVVVADNFEDESAAYARELAQGPTAAHRVTKSIVRMARAEGVRAADELMLQTAPSLVETTDMQTAVEAILAMGPRDFMASPSPVDFVGN